MLQISTGKFFNTEDLHVTEHRGVLYTNYRQFKPIETRIGSLLPAEAHRDILTCVCQLTERLPRKTPDGEDAVMISVGSQFMIQDFAAVASFCLDITLTGDKNLASRLTASEMPPLGLHHLPHEYVNRVFDRRVSQSAGDINQLQEFTKNLVALEREAYQSAMRAIRQYVTGLHRTADDLTLAYTMLVAAVESLAQGFADFTAEWNDVPDPKRTAVDEALTTAQEGTTDAVREALIEHEHLAARRRFIEFTLDSIQPSFFREEAKEENRPVRRTELPLALKRAYHFRSRFIHEVKELPRQLTHVPSMGDVRKIDRRPTLTLHGLARVARHVIRHFVKTAPKVADENFDYRQDLPNVVSMRMATKYWLGKPQGYSHRSAKRYLSGFLQELAANYREEEETPLTDLTSVLEEVEQQVPGLAKAKQRLPMLALYLLWHKHIIEKGRRPDWGSFLDQFEGDFDVPSPESLLVHVLLGEEWPWPLEESERIWEEYLQQRHHKHGLAMQPFFEAAVQLAMAEAYRREGNTAAASNRVSKAVETLPGHARLIEFEEQLEDDDFPEINPFELLTGETP